MKNGARWLLILGAAAIVAVLVLFPIRIGYESFTYRSAAKFTPSGEMLFLMDGTANRAARVDVSYKTSPDAPTNAEYVEFSVTVDLTWDPPGTRVSMLLVGSLSTGFSACTAGGELLPGEVIGRDDLTDLERQFLASVITFPEANGDIASPSDEEAQHAWEQLEGVELRRLVLDNGKPWKSAQYAYSRESAGVKTTFPVYRLEMTCRIERDSIWQITDTERVLNFPTVAVATNSDLGGTIVTDNDAAETALVLDRQVDVASRPDWTMASTTSTSSLGTDGKRKFVNGWNNYDTVGEQLVSTGFAALFSDRRAEARQTTEVFIAGVAAGVAAALVVSILKQLVLFAVSLWRRRG